MANPWKIPEFRAERAPVQPPKSAGGVWGAAVPLQCRRRYCAGGGLRGAIGNATAVAGASASMHFSRRRTVSCTLFHPPHPSMCHHAQRGRLSVVEELLRLHFDLGFDIVDQGLLKSGTPPTEPFTDSPLHRAVASGHAPVCRALLQVARTLPPRRVWRRGRRCNAHPVHPASPPQAGFEPNLRTTVGTPIEVGAFLK